MMHLKVMGLDWGLEHLSLFQGRCVELYVDPNGRRSTEVINYGSTTAAEEVVAMKEVAWTFKSIRTFKGCCVRSFSTVKEPVARGYVFQGIYGQ
jgi:hypothetical protein